MIDNTKAIIVFKQNNESLSASNLSNAQELITRQTNTLNTISKTTAQKFVFYSDYIEKEDIMEFDNWVKMPQYGNTFSEKLKDAFHIIKSGDYKKTIFINSLTQNLSSSILEEAFQRLDTNDVILGVDLNNNCYLLGFTQFNSDFFNNKTWESAPNPTEIEEEADKLGFSVAKLSQTPALV